MNNHSFEIVKQRVLAQMDSEEYEKAYAGTEQSITDRNHFLEIVKIVREIWDEEQNSELPEAIKIAALCHDLDRIYPKREVNTKNCSKEDYAVRKMLHSGNSALLFLETNIDLPKELLHDVVYLIQRHEVGGDKDKKCDQFDKKDESTEAYNLNMAADYLYFADKLTFFYTSIHEYKKRGIDRLKFKIKFSMEGLPNWIIKKIKSMTFDDNLIKQCIDEVVEEMN